LKDLHYQHRLIMAMNILFVLGKPSRATSSPDCGDHVVTTIRRKAFGASCLVVLFGSTFAKGQGYYLTTSANQDSRVVVVTDAGQVGINRTNPLSLLHVHSNLPGLAGTLRVDHIDAADSALFENRVQSVVFRSVPQGAGDSERSFVQLGMSGSLSQRVYALDATLANDLAGASANLALNLSGGNVGIGRVDPQDLLALSYGESFSFDASSPNQSTRLKWRFMGQEMAWIERKHESGDLIIANDKVERIRVGANGDVGVGTDHPTSKLDVRGKLRCEVLEVTSDRNAKTNVVRMDPEMVLRKALAMEIPEWEHLNAQGIRRLGPMAQDFFRAFGLGSDDKHISPNDMAAVSLVSLQALARRDQERSAEIARNQAEVALLKQQLAELHEEMRAVRVAWSQLKGSSNVQQAPPAP
jgi:hypothetical protein